MRKILFLSTLISLSLIICHDIMMTKFFSMKEKSVILKVEKQDAALEIIKVIEEYYFEKSLKTIPNENVSCFISHAWGEENQFVDKLNEDLRLSNINTYYDRSDIGPGNSISQFMTYIANVDYVITIFTPSYKERIENDQNNPIKREWGYIYHNLVGTTKFIPILYGEPSKSLPKAVNYIKYLDFNQSNYHYQFFDILMHMLPKQQTKLIKLREDCISKKENTSNNITEEDNISTIYLQ